VSRVVCDESATLAPGGVGDKLFSIGADLDAPGVELPLDDVTTVVALGSEVGGTLVGTNDSLELRTELPDPKLPKVMLVLAGDGSGTNACDDFEVM